MYNIEKIVLEAGGADYIKRLVEEEGLSQQEVSQILKINTSSKITYGKFLKYCGATIPFPKVSNRASRKWMIRWQKYGEAYWEDEFLAEEVFRKLENPILNTTGSISRYVISMWGHPSANTDSHQIKAHIIVWEMANECYLPEGYEVYPLDGNFLNLDVTNFSIRTTVERKSMYASGERNYFYTGAPKYQKYTRGWNRISRNFRNSITKCEVCGSTEKLNAHHIISYWLFAEDDLRVHTKDNLLCVCDSCHGKIHQLNTSIEPHISATRYKNLLELLESLKSQVPDELMETYRSVEKQLGLTGNQQPST